ncbi:MAG: hypothetical protein IJC48_11155 [Clostridia bacterium]|nr:hypothetical protein [Clostridia bacterium]
MRIYGIRISMNPLAPIMLILLSVFIGPAAALSPLIALSFHETAHLITAIKLKARVDEIELMPFGAAIRLYDLWETATGKLLIIVLSGPAANLLLSFLISLTLYIFPRLAVSLSPLLNANLAVMLLNLLPALPLDGGRALTAVISKRIGRTRAVHIGVWLGRVLSLMFLAISAYALFATGKIELVPLLFSIYIWASGHQEIRRSEGAFLRAMILTNQQTNRLQSAKVISVNAGTPIYEAAKAAPTAEKCIFSVEDDTGRILGFISVSSISKAILTDSAKPIGSLLMHPNSFMLYPAET